MSFAVFPDPQLAPLAVAPGATAFIPFSQLTGQSDPVGTYVKMMYIRVAMFGGVSPPTVFLKAGNGTEVRLNSFTTAVSRGPESTDYVGDARLFADANNVFRIRMGFDQDTSEQWQLGIKNNDITVTREFTWVVAESEAESAQPWIAVSPPDLAYHALVGDTLEHSVQVSNKGTGPLSITSTAPALPAGFAIGSTLPLTIPPSRSEWLTFTFRAPKSPPLPNGTITATVALTATPPDTTASNTSGHNQEVSLTATAQRLEVALLLDASGSMTWDAEGESVLENPADSRWSELSSATRQFLDLLAHFGQGRGRFGIARFPAEDPDDVETFDIVPMTDITDVAGMADAQETFAAVTPDPDSPTPMGDGLDRVLAPATTYFDTGALSVGANRRWLILMSDGAHNSGTHEPREFVGPPMGSAPAGSSLAEKRISLFAVGYGIEGFTDVDHVTLKELCSGSWGGGQQRFVDEEETTATALAAALRDAIKSGLTPTASPRDPQGTVLTGFGEVRHEVLLTRFDQRAALVLNWNTPDPGRLRLELLTPLQERITPETAGQGAFGDVVFRGDSRSQVYLIGPEFLSPGAQGDNQPAKARHGTWSLVITAPSDDPEAPEPNAGFVAEKYVYDTLVDSSLHLSLESDATSYFAGQPITVSAKLTAGGKPVTGASVSLSATVPTRSMANWLANLEVPEEAMLQADEEMTGLDTTPLLVKKRAAKIAGLRFESTRNKITLPMGQANGMGTYQGTLTDTSVPERYTFYVIATGTSDGVDFRREAKLETYVLVRPEPDHSVMDIEQFDSFAVATVTPRDRFDNALMIDPHAVGGFEVVGNDVDLGDIFSHLDGTYSVRAHYEPGARPSIGVSYAGMQVISPKTPLPLDELHYPDRVFAFAPGPMISSNAQRVPEAALGTLVQKDPDLFVALGGGGQLVVGFEEQVVLGGSDTDVTVFVRPDSDLRPYRVEVFSQEVEDWVSLGESSGVTESFALSAGGIESTPALRITDVSGRTRDSELNPLATPGVSVRGIGVRRTSRGLPVGREQLPDWLSRMWRGTH
ncbi:hypothetical protein ACIP17_31140 [Streptomyces iakyrus]|uniref:hypothetical protein n=1 Tax=Streptomyces iakyrus TaxID=68219 RepID=UPI0038240EDC